MEGPRDPTTPNDLSLPRSRWRPHGIALAILLVVAGAIHFWHLRHTEVPARDGIGFIRYAWQLETQDWTKVLRENPHPPLYPMSILAMSIPVRFFDSGNSAQTMQLSAQLISALAGVLLVIPMFFLGSILFHWQVGFWAALIFQCLPAGSRILSDALTEGIFLLLIMSLLVLIVHALRRNHFLYFGLIGLGSGLAYLARPEGLLLVLATGLVLLVRQFLPGRKIPWPRVWACGLALGIIALAVILPYMAVIGQFTNKTTGIEILQTGMTNHGGWVAGCGPSHATWLARHAPRLTPHATGIFATWGPDSREFAFLTRHGWCLQSLGREIIKGFHYVAWLPAILGLYWFRQRIRHEAGTWVLLLVLGLHFLLLWRVAYVAGYIAERHSLVFVALGLPFAVAALEVIAKRLDEWNQLYRNKVAPSLRERPPAAHRLRNPILRWLSLRNMKCACYFSKAPSLSMLMALGLAVSGLPKTLEPLHTNRADFHAAGLWLSQHAGPGEKIMDPFCWAEFYAGQQFWTTSYLYDVHTPPQYVVLGGTENEHKRLPLIPWAKKYAENAQVVYQWSPRKANSKAEEVVVYHIPK